MVLANVNDMTRSLGGGTPFFLGAKGIATSKDATSMSCDSDP